MCLNFTVCYGRFTQHHCNIYSFSFVPYTFSTQRYWHTLSSLCSPGQCWLSIYETKDTDEELITTGQLACSKRHSIAWQNVHISTASENFVEHCLQKLVAWAFLAVHTKNWRWHLTYLSLSGVLCQVWKPDEIKYKETHLLYVSDLKIVRSSLYCNWLAGGLATHSDQCVSDIDRLLSQSKEPSRLASRSQCMQMGGCRCRHGMLRGLFTATTEWLPILRDWKHIFKIKIVWDNSS